MVSIAPISEVKKRMAAYIEELGAEGRPLYVTQHGKPVAVLMTYEDYEALTQRLEDLSDLLAMKESLEAPEEEATALGEYERRRDSRVRG